MTDAMVRGDVYWVDFSPTEGREQHGRRPALVVSSADYLSSVPALVVVVPVTSVDRDRPHHVKVGGVATGLSTASFAMTEQPRTVSRGRLSRRSGRADGETMREVDQWLRDFLQL